MLLNDVDDALVEFIFEREIDAFLDVRNDDQRTHCWSQILVRIALEAHIFRKIIRLYQFPDIMEVCEESFRYSGPKPQTKESAIVSLADAVESASRTLEKPTPAKIEQLVHEIIEQRITDHQLDECDLTLRDLRIIAERFRFTLMTMLHSRIAYPKQETKSSTPRGDSMRPDVMATTRKPATAPPVSAA